MGDNTWGAPQDHRWGAAPIGAPQPRLYGPASRPAFGREQPVMHSPRVPAVGSYPPRPYAPLATTSAYPAPMAAPAWGRASGVLLTDNGKFGFIQQDSGEENMFVMPFACQAFGGRLPPLGTRVTYAIVMDN